jgi:hypothetical protein
MPIEHLAFTAAKGLNPRPDHRCRPDAVTSISDADYSQDAGLSSCDDPKSLWSHRKMGMAMAVTDTTTSEVLVHKSLVDEGLWQRLVNRIVKDESMERALAERIMNEALGFLRLCAAEPNAHYSPTPLVDIGWHTFILYTREYAAFSEKVAGQFIHHAPSDEIGVDYGTGRIARTASALRRHGLVFDEMLWSHRWNGECGCSVWEQSG